MNDSKYYDDIPPLDNEAAPSQSEDYSLEELLPEDEEQNTGTDDLEELIDEPNESDAMAEERGNEEPRQAVSSDQKNKGKKGKVRSLKVVPDFLSGVFFKPNRYTLVSILLFVLLGVISILRSYHVNSLLSSIDHLEREIELLERNQQITTDKLNQAIRVDAIEERLRESGSTLAPSTDTMYVLYATPFESLTSK